jgi:hypothetical protein
MLFYLCRRRAVIGHDLLHGRRMNHSLIGRFAFVATFMLPHALCLRAGAESLVIANPSFEAPVFADGSFAALSISPAQQGGYGWTFSDSSGIYNPPALDYATAGGVGAPAGAHGAQVGWIAGFGEYVIHQRLAGPDGIVDNGNDPVLEAFTVYTLTFDVGQRAPGNTFGSTAGGYDVQLRAGLEGASEALVARETDAVAQVAGNFIERSFSWDSALANSDRLGLPLTILLRKTIVSATADTDFDNVRLDAVYVPPTANFNGVGVVDASDLGVWQTNFGGAGAVIPSQGDYDRNLMIDGADFLWWQRQVGSGLPAGPAASEILEPASSTLLLTATLAFSLRPRPRRA